MQRASTTTSSLAVVRLVQLVLLVAAVVFVWRPELLYGALDALKKQAAGS